MAGQRPTRVLILGGGFGGVYAAMALQKRLARDPGVEITLVNRDNYFVFQPMLPEVISGGIGIVDPIIPLRRLCPRVNHIPQLHQLFLDLAQERSQLSA